MLIFVTDLQVSCAQAGTQYVPPLWVMCLESVAHLLVMFNCSSNFLVYCSVSQQFKAALGRVCRCFSGGQGQPTGTILPTLHQHLPSSQFYYLSFETKL